ncbi:MAG: hypothetical protein J0I12_16090 [Candidatus Eremiobacteraeota bacterium]|nr:hypothetical protein [Candidatus Eremiobacteraeota bacterium]
MLRLLLLILWICCCPALVWAQDDFCGHACPKHVDQVCHCDEHELCYRLALEKPGPQAPAPPRFEVLCPPAMQPLLAPVHTQLAAGHRPPAPRPLCPALAPEPPPPRI